MPAPFGSLAFGGGAGLLTAAVVANNSRKKESTPIGVVGELPGVPAKGNASPVNSRGKSLEKEQLLRRYDRAFAQMVSRHGVVARSEALEQIRPIIFELSPDIKAWTGDARMRVYLLLHELAKDFDNPSTAKASLDILFLILSKGGSSALEMVRPLFRGKIQEMYLETVHENERFLPRLLLMLDDYDPQAVEALMKDAIHVWGDDRFSAAAEYLGLDDLKERGLRNRLKGILGGEIARAGNELDTTALNRAVELYHEVR